MTGEVAVPSAGVTIVMPLKDPEPRYLHEALASVLEQTSPRWRLLIVIDGDEPRYRELLPLALAEDPRVRLVVNEGPRLAGAINTGVRHAETDFVALLFGDDRWDPAAVATLEWNIEAVPSADFFHSSRQIVDDDGHPISTVHRARRTVTLADFETGAPVKHLLCWRKAKGLAVGGLDERSKSVGPDDFDFPWTMAEHGARFFAIDECLYYYRDHRTAERLSTDLPLSVHVSELRRIFRKHGLGRRASHHRINEARKTYLQQCLYRSPVDRFFRRALRRPPDPWRDTYR